MIHREKAWMKQVDDGLNEAEERTSEGEHKTHELEEANQA